MLETMEGESRAMSMRAVQPVSEADKILLRDLTSETRTGYLLVGEDDILMACYYKKYADKLNNLEIRDSDIIVASHPKTGRYLNKISLNFP